jgi:SAM-dependent methyltransferase
MYNTGKPVDEARVNPQPALAYVCPRCKSPLDDLACAPCGASYAFIGQDIPCLVTDSAGSSRQQIRDLYDDIYRHHHDVWVDQGRPARFLEYFSELAASYSRGRVLEVGCGEGAQLAALSASRKFGIDLSVHALLRARERSSAECAVARAEELPFPAESMDLVLAVGVMEHFESADAATAEIRRVLAAGGRYLALLHTDMTFPERVALKAREFLVPRPRPLALLRWIAKKLHHPIVQPLRKSYTIDSARQCLERNGLHVTEVITRDSHPTAPLAGRHVAILIATKSSGGGRSGVAELKSDPVGDM